jgi:integral membrane protein
MTRTEPRDRPATARPRVAAAFARYRVLAWATGVFLLLLTLHVLLQWRDAAGRDLPWDEATGLGRWVPGADTWVPLIHGYLYLAYVITAVDVWLRTRLDVVRTLFVVLAGTLPGMSFVAERWVHRQLADRLALEAETPSELG